MKNAFIEELLCQKTYLKDCLDRYFSKSVPGLDEIEKLASSGKIRKVVLAGMGSSYYAAFCVSSYLTQKGIPAVVLNGFDAARYQWGHVTEDTLVIGISQSGRSWELAELIDKVKGRAIVAGIFNKEGSRLDTLSDIKLPMYAGTEVFFANRSFLHSLAVLNIVAHVITKDDLEELKEQLYGILGWIDDYSDRYDEFTRPLLGLTRGSDMFEFLADGPSMAAAYQGGIIFREGPAVKTASIMLADFAHDWVLSVNPSYTEILCVPEFTAEVETRMYNTILNKGGKAIVITANKEFKPLENTAVLSHPEVMESLAPMLQITCINYLMAYLLGKGWSR